MRKSHLDSISHLLRLAGLTATLDKRCLLSGSTRMDVAGHPEREAPFHVLLEGECELQVGPRRLHLRPGDVVVLPSGVPHRIVTTGSAPTSGVEEQSGEAFVTTRSEQGGTAVIDLFCGRYHFDAGAGATLFRSLPDPLHVSFGSSAESDEVLRTLSSLMRGEALREGEGTATILSALCVVLMAMVLRSPRGVARRATLWTAAADPRIAMAVEAVVADPGADWSIDRLSRQAAMSRATFLRRFTEETAMTVGQFVAKARVMAAAQLLTSTDTTVATVALRCGYRSESAFSRVFRGEVGTTPARFRRDQKAGRTKRP